jgi:hypothetical protein
MLAWSISADSVGDAQDQIDSTQRLTAQKIF